jgi:hypothetical protein
MDIGAAAFNYARDTAYFWQADLVTIEGFGLRRLISLFQKDEIFLLRQGISEQLEIKRISHLIVNVGA